MTFKKTTNAGPLISVFLPTYSRLAGGYLERSIQSVLSQSHSNFELFIVDDGSVDGSRELIQNYAAKDKRIIHVRNDINTGLPAYNTALAYLQSRGQYVAWVFDDCVLRTDHLSMLSDYLDMNQSVGMVYAKAIAHWADGSESEVGRQYNSTDMDMGNNHIPNVSVMVRRPVIDTVGWYDPHVILKRNCDWDLWRRISKKYKIGYLDVVLADEYGARLCDSLGNTFTVLASLCIKYSNTDRDSKLIPSTISTYDPFSINLWNNVSDDEISAIKYLAHEHFIKTVDIIKIVDSDMLYVQSLDQPSLLWNKITAKNQHSTSAAEQHILHSLVRYYDHQAVTIKKENAVIAAELRKWTQVADERLALIHDMANSLSWRITSPIRATWKIGRRLRKMAGSRADDVLTAINGPMRTWTIATSFIYRHLGRRPIRVLAIADGLIPSIELGLIQPLKHLQDLGEVRFTFRLIGDLKYRDLLRCDIVFAKRVCTPKAEAILRHAAALKRGVIYGIDDDFESLDPNTSLGRYYLNINAWEHVKTICSLSDKVFVFSKGLCDKISPLNPNTELMPALANHELIETLRGELPQRSMDQPPVITIGYAAGPHHAANLSVATAALRKVLQELGEKVRFETFFGAIPKGFEGLKNVQVLSSIEGDITTYYRTLIKRGWVIGIAPLEDTVFNRSKSNNKYREYAACGIAGIYSDVPAYHGTCIHGSTGMLAANETESWYRCLMELINSPALRDRIVKQSGEDIANNYSMEAITQRYLQALRAVLHQHKGKHQ